MKLSKNPQDLQAQKNIFLIVKLRRENLSLTKLRRPMFFFQFFGVGIHTMYCYLPIVLVYFVEGLHPMMLMNWASKPILGFFIFGCWLYATWMPKRMDKRAPDRILKKEKPQKGQ